MNNFKAVALRVKNHVARQRYAYAMGLVAASAIALQQRNRIDFYAFLESKDINPMEFYCPEMFEELNS